MSPVEQISKYQRRLLKAAACTGLILVATGTYMIKGLPTRISEGLNSTPVEYKCILRSDESPLGSRFGNKKFWNKYVLSIKFHFEDGTYSWGEVTGREYVTRQACECDGKAITNAQKQCF